MTPSYHVIVSISGSSRAFYVILVHKYLLSSGVMKASLRFKEESCWHRALLSLISQRLDNKIPLRRAAEAARLQAS